MKFTDRLSYRRVRPKCFVLVLISLAVFRFLPSKQLLPNKTPNKFLIVDVRGGLTNQQIMISEALVLAQFSTRALVLPRVRAHLINETYASGGVATTPLEELWDVEHFERCARRLGVYVVPESSLPRDGIEPFTQVHQPWGLVESEIHYPRIVGSQLFPTWAASKLNQTAPVVKIIAPFYLVNHGISQLLSNFEECFVTSPNLQQLVQQNRPTEAYYCLHARVEVDWFCHCCQDWGLEVDLDQPDTWRCPNGKPPPTTCYQTPAQITSTLLQALPHNSTLWVASGARRTALEPLYQSFQVKRFETTQFMDYALALADREICAGAKEAWVMQGSTFSTDIAKRTKIIWYNRIQPTN